MPQGLSPSKLKAARGSFYTFNTLNSISFVLLSGSFITLFALRLGASASLVGLLNAFGYATYFFLPLGKRLVRRRPIVEVFGWNWTFRYFTMIPVLAAPFFASRGELGLAFGLILAGVALFNVFRGVALIGNNPVLAFLAEGRDSGAFLVNVQIVNNVASMLTNLLAVLGKAAGTGLYGAFIAGGIVVGILGCVFLLKTPEPEAYRPTSSSRLLSTTKQALSEKPFRAFFAVLVTISFVAGMARSFLPVYAKDVYAQGDDLVMVYSLLASVGAIAMGFLTRLLVDRLGAKPLYVIFTAISALSLVPAIVSPALSSPLKVMLFLGAFNFLSSFGLAGEENAGQTYYLALVPKEKNLDLSVVYFVAYGIGGAVGSMAGGFVLEGLKGAGIGPAMSYRIFFAALALVLVYSLIRMGGLVRLGSASVRESLSVMFSFRDLKVFDLLQRLDRSASAIEEIDLIHEIGSSGSPRSQHELLSYLESPRFEVRVEALLAIENLDGLDRDVLEALAADVKKNPFTTAYLGARILGKQGSEEFLPILRAALPAQDYMLQGAAMVAVARLGDRSARGEIEDILVHTAIPRVRIQAAYALEILSDRESVPTLVSCLRSEDPPAYVSDELVLAVADILGLMNDFYPMYVTFLGAEEEGRAILEDRADSGDRQKAEGFKAALAAILAEPPLGEAMGRLVLSVGVDPGVELVLADAALDSKLGYRGFRFFIAAYAALAGLSPARQEHSPMTTRGVL
jgi:HEAT repeat protein